MIRIAISQAAFDAIARTMPFGSVNFEAGVDANGERYIWLPRAVVDRLRALRGQGERALSRQISIGHFRSRISPSDVAIHEQKQWCPTAKRHPNRQYRI
jgi:hypothetical protein